jgi:hypothetical protein
MWYHSCPGLIQNFTAPFILTLYPLFAIPKKYQSHFDMKSGHSTWFPLPSSVEEDFSSYCEIINQVDLEEVSATAKTKIEGDLGSSTLP